MTLVTSYAYKMEMCLEIEIIQDPKKKGIHPLMSLYREIIIQECFSLECYPLVVSRESFVIILYYSRNDGVYSVVFPSQRSVFHVKILSPFIFISSLCDYSLFVYHSTHCGK